MLSLRQCLAASAILSAVPPCLAAMPTSYSQMIVFGDSLSDTGNNGRYSASYLWDEHVAGAFGLALTPSSTGGTDYAVSGSSITGSGPTSLPGQVNTYLAAHPQADGQALYAIWGGGNDLFSTLGNPGAGPGVQAAGIALTLNMIQSLYKAGARHFLIGEVPATYLTPYVQGLGASAINQQQALEISWNRQLEKSVHGLSLPGATLSLYSSVSFSAGAVLSPTHFGYTDYTNACDNTCPDPAHTLFWDYIHPGATAHAQIGAGALSVLTR